MKAHRLSRKTVYKGKYFTVMSDKIKLPNGKHHTYDLVSRGPYVAVVALVNNQVVMIKNHRYVINKIVWEIPLGLVDKGESPRHSALRELEEESGYKAEKIIKLISIYPSYGMSNEMCHVFFANGLKKTRESRDATEFLETELWSIDRAFREIGRKIVDSATIIGLTTARERGLL